VLKIQQHLWFIEPSSGQISKHRMYQHCVLIFGLMTVQWTGTCRRVFNIDYQHMLCYWLNKLLYDCLKIYACQKKFYWRNFLPIFMAIWQTLVLVLSQTDRCGFHIRYFFITSYRRPKIMASSNKVRCQTYYTIIVPTTCTSLLKVQDITICTFLSLYS
jgi:hypothetical protein